MREVRPPVFLLRSVVRERVGEEIFRHRWRPPWEFQRLEAPADVVQNLANHRNLRDEPDHAHPLTASAKQWVDLVDATDQPGPRLPALLEPGGFGLRGTGG